MNSAIPTSRYTSYAEAAPVFGSSGRTANRRRTTAASVVRVHTGA